MNKNHVPVRRSLASLVATSLLLAACGQRDIGGPSTVSPSTDSPSESSGDTIASAQIATAEPDLAAAEINRFGADLLAAVGDAAPTENVVVSPFSVATALAMTSVGARGKTAEEMATVLGGDAVSDADTGDPVDAYLNDFQPSMNGLLSSLAERGATADGAELEFANSVWGQNGINWKPDFLQTLTKTYDTEMFTADFAADADGAADEINQWVANATNDRITDLLAPGVLNNLTRMVLVNAVYLTADWETPFEAESTWDQDFTTATGDVVSVPMMHMHEGLNAAVGDGWTAVELPYAAGDLSMVVAVPDQLSEPAESPSIEDVIDELSTRDVVLSLPKFEVDHKASLNDTLAQLGMPTAFVFGEADFSGMTDDEKLYISDVVHQANITVDEKGTEAAAATAVMEAAGAAPGEDEVQPLEIDVDRPFTFWLRDTVTGVVIFTGRVNNPQP